MDDKLLDFTRNYINEQPQEWDQSVYFMGKIDTPVSGYQLAETNHVCGSTGCVAGWASLFGGWMQIRDARMISAEDVARYREHYNIHAQQDRHGNWWAEWNGSDVVVNPANGEMASMRDAARDSIGLTDDQAGQLFYGANSLDTVNDLVDQLLANPNAEILSADRVENGD